jgi:hypothetical protein
MHVRNSSGPGGCHGRSGTWLDWCWYPYGDMQTNRNSILLAGQNRIATFVTFLDPGEWVNRVQIQLDDDVISPPNVLVWDWYMAPGDAVVGTTIRTLVKQP